MYKQFVTTGGLVDTESEHLYYDCTGTQRHKEDNTMKYNIKYNVNLDCPSANTLLSHWPHM